MNKPRKLTREDRIPSRFHSQGAQSPDQNWAAADDVIYGSNHMRFGSRPEYRLSRPARFVIIKTKAGLIVDVIGRFASHDDAVKVARRLQKQQDGTTVYWIGQLVGNPLPDDEGPLQQGSELSPPQKRLNQPNKEAFRGLFVRSNGDSVSITADDDLSGADQNHAPGIDARGQKNLDLRVRSRIASANSKENDPHLQDVTPQGKASPQTVGILGTTRNREILHLKPRKTVETPIANKEGVEENSAPGHQQEQMLPPTNSARDLEPPDQGSIASTNIKENDPPLQDVTQPGTASARTMDILGTTRNREVVHPKSSKTAENTTANKEFPEAKNGHPVIHNEQISASINGSLDLFVIFVLPILSIIVFIWIASALH